MKKIIKVFLLYIILFFFTGCFAVMEIDKETPEKISAGTSEKTPKVKRHSCLLLTSENLLNTKRRMNCKWRFIICRLPAL